MGSEMCIRDRRRSRSGNQSGRGGKKEAKVKKVATEVNSDEDGGNSSDE